MAANSVAESVGFLLHRTSAHSPKAEQAIVLELHARRVLEMTLWYLHLSPVHKTQCFVASRAGWGLRVDIIRTSAANSEETLFS